MIVGYIKRALPGHHSKALVRLFQKVGAPSHSGHRLYMKYAQPEINAPADPRTAAPGVVVRLRGSELFRSRRKDQLQYEFVAGEYVAPLDIDDAAVTPPTDPRSPCANFGLSAEPDLALIPIRR
jgi:hypothetical protein